ncbi:TetR family transcriptional regulator [Streptomyces platensis]|uniref:TetR family transcriptional regulator n=1 Tax=Streptomyces platensis TaxID=58346 RepID=A0AAE6NQL1_STRPT|nr:TetR family transcriptional regulator [Streptomyces platensis]OSY48499.1 Tetracycline repressor protein class H [Streptomyces platensis]QEV55896.1 TetR family transcriptional regulator [Streptomyces platensis]
MESARKAPRGTRKRDTPLTEEGIYAAALRLIDADGVKALTMRKLAAELDANPMSLYHHVPNKDALLKGVARLAGSEFRTAERNDLPWQENVRQLALDFRSLAHRHPNLVTHVFTRPDFIQPDDPFWRGLTGALGAAGVPEREIPRVSAVLCAVFSGLLVAELNGALRRWMSLSPMPTGPDEAEPPAAAEADVDAMFGIALDATIAGLESQLADTRRR